MGASSGPIASTGATQIEPRPATTSAPAVGFGGATGRRQGGEGEAIVHPFVSRRASQCRNFFSPLCYFLPAAPCYWFSATVKGPNQKRDERVSRFSGVAHRSASLAYQSSGLGTCKRMRSSHHTHFSELVTSGFATRRRATTTTSGDAPRDVKKSRHGLRRRSGHR